MLLFTHHHICTQFSSCLHLTFLHTKNGAKVSKDSKMNKMSLDLHIFYSFLWRLNAVISFVPDFHHFVPSPRLQKTVDLYLICLVLHKHNKKWYYKTHIYCRHVLKDSIWYCTEKCIISQNSAWGKSMLLPQKLVWYF